ncbi:Short-chain dehydrogenase/reductase family protein [Mycena indigotica]|uniref:Short-chain dehydrogenase/reductase family protein n=1 Tax=Mycena indigotica TaxID=2126181 RepID=A0A8H6SQ96_9AGAR|nr:Short-chain dehydrogenase/reductase family protein [Mycena indigotica]KAF7303454.1 Short-chain dehydrogenase/reductase family protein [Mycena indigotica]
MIRCDSDPTLSIRWTNFLFPTNASASATVPCPPPPPCALRPYSTMGNVIAALAPQSSLSVDLWPPPPTFDLTRDIPDLSGYVALVTGGNSGIGYYVVQHLARKGAKVYLAGRNSAKTHEAVARLKADGEVVFLEVDLADLRSVKRAADEFLAMERRLDILVNNGCVLRALSLCTLAHYGIIPSGVMNPPTTLLTAQNLDAAFGTNIASHHLLTTLLLPALKASHAATGKPARVLSTASSTHTRPSGVSFTSLIGGKERDEWLAEQWGMLLGFQLYAQSKLIGVVITNHWAKTHAAFLVASSVHPGSINTDLKRHFPSAFQLLWQLALNPPLRGAYPLLWAAAIASPSEITAEYIVPPARKGVPNPLTRDAAFERQVVSFVDDVIQDYL